MKICTKCNIGQIDTQFAHWHMQCKSCIALYQRNYRLKNKSAIYAKKAIYKKQNPELYAKISKKWRKIHPERKLADTVKRQLSQIKRIPKWLTHVDWIEIKWAYKIAKDLTRETGIKHVVDHIIPLRGKNISGLHCPQNLQIITRQQNLEKSNKFPYLKG